MDDHRPMPVPRLQEGPTDPSAVLGRLLIQHNPWAHTGVNEKVIAYPMMDQQTIKELAMRFREGIRQTIGQCLPPPAAGRRPADAITRQCFEAAEIQPMRIGLWIRQEIEHRLFVIAGEEDPLRPRNRRRPQKTIDHPPAVRPAIDIIAKIKDRAAFRRPNPPIGFDTTMERVKFPHATMDIANGINPTTVRHPAITISLFARPEAP